MIQFHNSKISVTYNNNNNWPYEFLFVGSPFLIAVTSDSHSIYSIDNNPLLVKISIFTYNNMHVCISLRFLNNAFQLTFTIYMFFLIGLRPFVDAYQFQLANVSVISFMFLISSLLKWPTDSLAILIESILFKFKTSCRVN